MKTTVRRLTRVYALLLRLYPREFRIEFEREMQAVFAEAVDASRQHGGLALVRLCLREIWDLPKNVAAQHWLIWGHRRGKATMNETIHITGPNNHPAQDEQRGAWSDAALAGLPHILTALLALLPLGAFNYGSAFIPILLFPLFGFIVAALMLAWRRGWPRWAASWYVYAALIVLMLFGISLQQSTIPLGQMLGGAYFSVVVPLACAAWLYWITRRDQIKGLLIAAPLMLLLWAPILEFVEPTLHNSIMLGMVLFAAAIAAAIIRLNNMRAGVWLVIGASLLTGLLTAYARTYWHNLPPEYSEPPTLAILAERFAPQLLAGSTLMIGPLLAWGVWELGQRHGRAGQLSARLIIAGVMTNLIGHLTYWWWFSERDYVSGWLGRLSLYPSGSAWSTALVYLGLLVALAGAVWLSTVVWRNHGKTLSIPLILVPLALPFMGMLPTYLGYHIIPAGWSFELVGLADAYKYLIYAAGLVWLALGGWLVTRLSALPRPGEAV